MGGRGGGGVEVRENSIRILYTIPGAGRQRRTLTLNGRPLPPTPPNVRHAHRLAADIRARIAAGAFNEADFFEQARLVGGDTVDAQLTRWLNAQRVTESTRAGYESAAKFWRSAVGTVTMGELKAGQIAAAIAARPALSGKTINNYVSVLREALQAAVADQLLAANPAAAIPRAKHQKQPPDPFAPDERDAILQWMDSKAPASVANLVRFWFWTGLRTSEIFGLRWPSVDLRADLVSVAEALVRGKTKSSTKTHTARLVRLNSQARAALDAQRAHTHLAGQHVFTDPRYGTPWTEERAFRRSFWEPCLRQMGIRYRRPYNMRHTYATVLLMSRVKPAFAARQLGHSLEMFFGTYARWIDGEADDREMAQLESQIVPALSPGKNAEGSAS